MKIFGYVFCAVCRIVVLALVFLHISCVFLAFEDNTAITPENVFNAVKSGFVFGLAVGILFYTLKIVIWFSKRNRMKRFLMKKGYCDEFYNIIRKKILNKSGKKAVEFRLFLVKQLCFGERYDEALEEISGIDTSKMAESLFGEYYSLCFYATLMSGAVDESLRICRIGGDYITRNPLGQLGLGIYKYSIGKYPDAEDIFLDFKFFTDKYIRQSAGMYTALCYLKCNKKEEAKDIVCELIPTVDNPVLKENLAKLMRLVEIAYSALEEEPVEEDTEKITSNFIEDTEESEEISQDAGGID